GGGPGAQGPQDPRALPAGADHRRPPGQGGRPALRPDVGGVRGAPPARLHPRLRPRGVLPAHRLHERALGRAGTPPRLVVPREGLPQPPGDHGGPRPRVRAPPQDLVRGPPRGAQRREPGPRVRRPRQAAQHGGRDRSAHRRAGPPAAHRAEVLREVPGPDPLRDRCRAAPRRRALPAAGLQGRALRDLLPVPRDRGRVLRLRACPRPAPGALADLRPRPSRRHPREGVPGQRPPRAGAAVVSAALLLAAALAAGDPSYPVGRAEAPRATLLGSADVTWSKAERIAWGPEKYETAFRALWDQTGLYVRFDARDPDPWSTMTRRDEHLWEEEVVEIFLDLDRSGKDYAEVEVSPANVICDVRMVS